MYFNTVLDGLGVGSGVSCIVTASRNVFRGVEKLSLIGVDWALKGDYE
jgi:hypothetical protein